MLNEPNEFLTSKELAAILRVNVETIYRMVDRGQIVCHRIGRAKRFRRYDVEEFLARCRTIERNHDDEPQS